TGPGYSTDGGLRFDFTKLDQSYFDRMRSRVIAAGAQGIYVSVMLFNGFEWQFDINSKDGNPFLDSNNVNAINCPRRCPTDLARQKRSRGTHCRSRGWRQAGQILGRPS